MAAPRPAQSRVQWVPRLSAGVKVAGACIDIPPHRTSRVLLDLVYTRPSVPSWSVIRLILPSLWNMQECRNSALGIARGADKSLARPGWKQATATEDFEFRISYL